MSLEHRTGERLEEPEVREVLRIRGEDEFGAVPQAPPKLSRRRLIAVAASSALVLAVFAMRRPSEMPMVAPPLRYGVPGRTVPVGSVPYGPDTWEGGVVDPSFVPQGPLPRGIAVSAMVGMTLWGCGDGNAPGAQPPEGKDAEMVEARLLELVSYVRDEVRTRRLPAPLSTMKDPELTTKLPSIAMTLGLDWRNGSGGWMVTVPSGIDAKSEAELRRVVHNVAKKMTDSTADSIQWMRQNDPNLP